MISSTGNNHLLGLRNLPYPLNVYALVFDWDTGSVEHLHYGHYEHAAESIRTAQDRAVELLCKQLPARGKILEVGCGFGSLTHRLTQAGYDVTGISPDPVQIELARSRYGDELPVHCMRLEDFVLSAGEWDLLLFHESAQYIAPLDLFECASRLLTPSGEILILDEFALKRTESGPETLPLKKYFISLAERQGFACRTQLDCSQVTAPTLDYLLQALDRHRDRILDITGLSPVTIDTLIDANRCCREKYRSGRFGYCLLHLQRSNIPRWQLARIKEADQPAVSSLFEEVFGHPLSPELWDWKYGSGGGQAVGLWQDGVLIAHYGGVPRCFERNGEGISGIQNCDVMVKPAARSWFGRRGPFFLVAATFLEQFVGHGTSSPLGFGFPNERAFRLPFKLGFYTRSLTCVRQVEWPAQSRAALLLDTRPLNLEAAGDMEIADMLWQRMVDDLSSFVVGVRNADYLLRRYQAHPQNSYQLILLRYRLTRKPLAVIVVKADGDRMELLDWISALAHFPRVVAAVRHVAAKAGARSVYLWANDPLIEQLTGTDPKIVELNVTVPANAWTGSSYLEEFTNNLWLTGGDTDFH